MADVSDKFHSPGICAHGLLRYRHGFQTAYNTYPTNYTGPTTPNYPATNSYCAGVGNAQRSCAEITTPFAPTALAASTGGPATFTAAANGDIDGDSTRDAWTMNQAKVLTNTEDDVGN